MTKNNSRGSAMLEALPVVILLLVFVVGILATVYLLFARSTIQYHGEQALICAAKTRSSFPCKSELERNLKKSLPWGELAAVLHFMDGRSNVEVRWKFQGITLRIEKELTLTQILNAKALRW